MQPTPPGKSTMAPATGTPSTEAPSAIEVVTVSSVARYFYFVEREGGCFVLSTCRQERERERNTRGAPTEIET